MVSNLFIKRQNFILCLVSLALMFIDENIVLFIQEIFHGTFSGLGLANNLFLPVFILAGEGSGGGGSDSGFSMSVQSTSVSVTDTTTGVTYSGTMDAMGNFSCSNGETFSGIGEPSAGVSTPFLRVWDGRRFKLENDFLFGKPNTSFINKEIGEREYQSGAIGGDTYILNTTPVESDGLLKMQIREIEPEESFIDTLSLLSIDLSPREYLVANGNLKEFHVFDRDRTRTVSDKHVLVSRVGTIKPTAVSLSYDKLGEGYGSSQVLNTGDELVVRVGRSALEKTEDVYILVDSHYRDWTLGNEVPFSRLERLGMTIHTMARSSFGFIAGLAMMGGGILGSLVRDGGIIPYTYADTPHTGGSGGGTGGSRSLVVIVRDGSQSIYLETYLETIFPRYAQASQEVVRIPHDFLKSLKSDFFTVHIRATKKHKVRAAFVFVGETIAKVAQPVDLVSAFHRRLQADVGKIVSQKDFRYLETIPGDVIDLVWKNRTQPAAGESRRYVLKADGFYTRLSDATKSILKGDWYENLDSGDRSILRSFKRQQST